MEASRKDPLPKNALMKVPRQPRSVNLVHSILDAAVVLIAEEGATGVTTNRIAEKAGVSIGSLYQYFANRDSIIAGVIERSLLDLANGLQSGLVMSMEMPMEAMLEHGLIGLFEYYAPYRTAVRRLLLEAPLMADTSVPALVELLVMDILRDYLVNNSDRYRLEGGPAALYVATNAIIFLGLKWLVSPSPLISDRQFAQTVARLLTSIVREVGPETPTAS